jgi:hypothetical protein
MDCDTVLADRRPITACVHEADPAPPVLCLWVQNVRLLPYRMPPVKKKCLGWGMMLSDGDDVVRYGIRTEVLNQTPISRGHRQLTGIVVPLPLKGGAGHELANPVLEPGEGAGSPPAR